MAKQLIQSEEEFKRIAEQEGTFVFFKHSITCPISQAAFHEFDAFANQHEDVPAYYLQVQEARPLSNFIAETYGVKHESLRFSSSKAARLNGIPHIHKLQKRLLSSICHKKSVQI